MSNLRVGGLHRKRKEEATSSLHVPPLSPKPAKAILKADCSSPGVRFPYSPQGSSSGSAMAAPRVCSLQIAACTFAALRVSLVGFTPRDVPMHRLSLCKVSSDCLPAEWPSA